MKTSTKVGIAAIIIIAIIIILLSLRTQTAALTPAPQPTTDSVSGQSFSQTYTNNAEKFTLQYPTGYTPQEAYVYNALGPNRDIPGVKFTIPEALWKGTNLSGDSYLSVEWLHNAVNSCSAEIYLSDPHSTGFEDRGGRRYSIASTSGAGAGNRYDEVVYATPVSKGCLAVRYFIHYGVFGNYPSDSVTEFDKQAVLAQFNSIRYTLKINK